jgi:hypothetical protein
MVETTVEISTSGWVTLGRGVVAARGSTSARATAALED